MRTPHEFPAARLSIVIPTWDGGANQVAHTLDSLARASGGGAASVEVLVVGNGRADRIGELVPDFQARLPGIRYVHEPRAGKCHALNRAMVEARGAWLAFLDHDVEVAPDYLSGLGAVTAMPDYGVHGGRVIPQGVEQLPRWATGDRPVCFSVGGIVAHDHGPEGRPYAHGMKLPIGASVVVRADLLRAVGGFDERLGPRPGAHLAGEDTDLCLKLRALGEKIRYSPEITVYHPVTPERSSRRYARHRLFMDGRTTTRMSAGRVMPAWLGAPRFLYRRMGEKVAAWLTSLATFDSWRIAQAELDLWYVAGQFAEYWRPLGRPLV